MWGFSLYLFPHQPCLSWCILGFQHRGLTETWKKDRKMDVKKNNESSSLNFSLSFGVEGGIISGLLCMTSRGSEKWWFYFAFPFSWQFDSNRHIFWTKKIKTYQINGKFNPVQCVQWGTCRQWYSLVTVFSFLTKEKYF